MAGVFNKENMVAFTSSDPLQSKAGNPSPRRTRKGRSKSIGPGPLEEDDSLKKTAKAAKDRRKSAFVPATKSILSRNEDAEKAARRKTMVNRRVSFAPEATLHTWDVVEMARDQTTSTDSSDGTRRNSHFTRSTNSSSPAHGSDAEEGDGNRRASPVKAKPGRRASGYPRGDIDSPEDAMSSGESGSSDVSGSEGEEEVYEADDGSDDTGTAMSLDVDVDTMHSGASSDNSTGSSARLEAALQAAAHIAGTRGIEYDEYGETSMEIVGEEVTNAFKPWAQKSATAISATLDQENINPFSPAFRASVKAGRPATIAEGDEEEDMSMEMTRAVGGILKARAADPQSSPFGEESMDLTRAVGKITSQKRRRSTTETGSPGVDTSRPPPKRRRSSVAQSSIGDDTMGLTMAVGGIQSSEPLRNTGRRRSAGRRRSSGVASEASDATMEFTRAVGGIRSTKMVDDDSFDGNEELSMELTTVLGGIQEDTEPAVEVTIDRPVTPRTSASSVGAVARRTPQDQERFKDAPDLQAKKLLTPLFEDQLKHSEEQVSGRKTRLSLSPVASRKSVSSTKPATRQRTSEGKKALSLVETADQPRDEEAPIASPDLPPLEETASPLRTPTHTPTRHENSRSSVTEIQQSLDSQLQIALPSSGRKDEPELPPKSAATPERHGAPVDAPEDARTLANSIRLMSTPRKETLRNVSPKKHTPKPVSPLKMPAPKVRATPKQQPAEVPSPTRRLNEDLDRIQAGGSAVEQVGLQDFLAKAGIRFMDLTTTKRRMTTAPTPSKTRKAESSQDDYVEDETTLESGVVAAACTAPELELYQHACHELKQYMKTGKQEILQLEANTLVNTPPLLRAYMQAAPERRAALDVHMRDMKTNARFRSKEIWYSWRSKLLGELMNGLQKIGEGLIADDDVLAQSEEVLHKVLPGLLRQRDDLQQDADRLEESVNAVSEEDKEELKVTREHLTTVNDELAEKCKVLMDLRRQAQEQDDLLGNLEESRQEFTAAIKEADRVRESCRGISTNEVATLKASVKHLEETFGWAITSASSSPSTVTMTYKSELQLFFHPSAFQQTDCAGDERPNAPISLTYIADAQTHSKKAMTTTLRFFLQLLRASLQGLPQCTTSISELLAFVSKGWDTASTIAETSRRLGIEALSETRIVGDERLAVDSFILLPKVRTKVRASFELTAVVDEDLEIRTSVEPSVVVVYGEQYNERNMTEFLRAQIGNEMEGWEDGMKLLREKLVARGVKGVRKC